MVRTLIGLTIIFSCAALFGAGAVAGEACETRDYREEMGPPRDQGETSWCFAVTATELVSQAAKQRVSAFDVTASVFGADEEGLLTHPDPNLASYIRATEGFFDQLKMDREINSRSTDPMKALDFFINTGGQLEAAVMMTNAKGLCLERDLPATKESDFQKEIGLVRRRLAQRMTRAKPPEKDAALWVEKLIARSLTDHADRRCKRLPREKAFVPKVSSLALGVEQLGKLIAEGKLTPEGVAKFIFAEVDRALDSGRIAGIDYSLHTLQAPDPDDKDKHAEHSSSIVARKKIGGKCMYLVRNSFGSDCSDYRRKFAKRCENGHVWVEPRDLGASAHTVTWIQ